MSQTKTPTKELTAAAIALLIALGLLIALFFGALTAWKKFKVYSKAQDGRAALAEAEFSKQIQLAEAKANLEAEKLNALAEVERAKGAAEAIEVEGGNLTENYIRYLWIRNLDSLDDGTIIYVPTEGGLPLLEAGRLNSADAGSPE